MMMTVQEMMREMMLMIKLSESLSMIMMQLQNMRIISWKDIDLNWSLITILEEDETIRQGLFPVPGASKHTSLTRWQAQDRPSVDASPELIQEPHEVQGYICISPNSRQGELAV